MKEYWGVEVHLHAFLILAVDGVNGKRHAPAALPPGTGPLLSIG